MVVEMKKLILIGFCISLVLISGCFNIYSEVCGKNKKIHNFGDGYYLCKDENLNITYKTNKYIETNYLEEPYYVCSVNEEKLYYESISGREEYYSQISEFESRHFVFIGGYSINKDIYVGADICFLEETFKACEKRIEYCTEEKIDEDINFTYVEYVVWNYKQMKLMINGTDGDKVKQIKSIEIINKLKI